MDNYVVYFFLGKALEEQQKISKWNQWQRCFTLFDEILSPYVKTARIASHQMCYVPLKSVGRVTIKKVPKLATLKWTYEDNKKWSEYSCITTSPYKIQHYETTIVSSKGKNSPDICIFLEDHLPAGAGFEEYLYNQALTVSIRESVHNSISQAYWNTMIEELSSIFYTVRVGRAVRPWQLFKMGVDPVLNNPVQYNSGLDLPRFVRGQTVEFSDYFQTWEYLK